MGESTTSVRRITATERQRQALLLRKGGASFPQIAEKLGYRSPSGAHKAVMAALKKMIQQPAAEVKEMELARLDDALMAIYPDVRRGHLGAVDRLLRILDRRSKYLGLDAPVRVKDETPGDWRLAILKKVEKMEREESGGDGTE